MGKRTALRQTISFGRETISFALKYSTRKTLSISVNPDLSVDVTAPKGKDIDSIKVKVLKRGRWILKQKNFFETFLPPASQRRYVSGETHFYLGRQYRLKVIKGNDESVKLVGGFIHICHNGNSSARRVKELLDDWFLSRARIRFGQSLEKCHAELMKRFVPLPALRIRKMTRRWGSCTSRAIYLNRDLIKAPSHCIDYVLTHELCHLRYRRHNKRFYDLMTRVMPDWEQRKTRLEKVSANFLSGHRRRTRRTT
jgi:predicted metal-dependent hydrolase